MLEPLKPLYNASLRPAARWCARIGIHPNHVTIVGLLFFIAAGIICAIKSWHYALLLVVAGSLFDGLDGVLARESGKTSRFGAILDSSCDRLTEMALLGGLLVYYQQSTDFNKFAPLLCYGVLCTSVMVSYVKARCEGEGIACSRGILQRPERLVLLSIGLLIGPKVMMWILAIMLLLGIITIFQRFFEAASTCRNSSSGS
jgi:CDP-diacylglycerol---glycerol-3-phosphate 3-phosphatidyltransferase